MKISTLSQYMFEATVDGASNKIRKENTKATRFAPVKVLVGSSKNTANGMIRNLKVET